LTQVIIRSIIKSPLSQENILASIVGLNIWDFHIGALVGYVISLIYNYQLNKRITFVSNQPNFYRYLIVSLLGLVINLIITTIFVKNLHVDSLVVTPLAAFFVMFWNFFMLRKFAFPK
jgi:putative flippase GtrA